METFVSSISGIEFPNSEKIDARTMRHSLISLIQKDVPSFNQSSFLSIEELNYYREKYIASMISEDMDALSEMEKTVIRSVKEHDLLTDKVEESTDKPLTLGQRIADKVASFGGSWTFIISFGIFITLWISGNVILLANRGYDPYPFILLNLILSCIAAIQAPVIMMSQNRQEEKDRERSRKDYMINLKSELEIRILHEKIDHLIMHQQQELLEIQKVQVDMMKEIMNRVSKEQASK
jgi:uncharacterized membrane protein